MRELFSPQMDIFMGFTVCLPPPTAKEGRPDSGRRMDNNNNREVVKIRIRVVGQQQQ